MNFRFTLAAVSLFLLLHVVPSKAQQFAYSGVERPAHLTASLDPEVSPRAEAYKLVHGVVQGARGTLPGATVFLQGSRTIVVTNAEGEFELRVPATAKTVQLVCGYGGLQDEVVTLTPVRALGSVYLLRTKGDAAE